MKLPNPNRRRTLVAIDPGRNLGWALFMDFGPPIPNLNPGGWVLKTCGLVRSSARDMNEQIRETLLAIRAQVNPLLALTEPQPLSACEFMEWRPNDVRSVAADLIRVATIGAAVAGSLSPEPYFIPPNDWKASTPDDVMSRRTLQHLGIIESRWMNEALTSVPDSLRHNTVDAIGIGLFATGRMQRGGFVPTNWKAP